MKKGQLLAVPEALTRSSESRPAFGTMAYMSLLEITGLRLSFLLYLRITTGGSEGKESACSAGDLGWIPESGRRKWQPTPVFLSGKSYGQRSLVGYSLWGHKRVDHDLATKQ